MARRKRFRLSLNAKIHLFAALVTLTSVVVAGTLTYGAQRRQVQTILGELLINIARTGALFVDGDAHERILGPLQVNGAEYTAVKALLSRIQVENQIAEKAIFTARRLNDKTIELVVCLGEPRVGSYYDPRAEPLQKIAALYRTGRAQYTAPYDSGTATFISAVAPIKGRDGAVVGFLEVDYDLAASQATLARTLRILVGALGIGAALALALAFLMASRITAPIRELESLVREVSRGEGDLTRRVAIDTPDVLGRLAAAFNDFVAALELIVRRVMHSTRDVGSSAVRVKAISEAQVTSVAEQAAAVSETSRTIMALVETFERTRDRSELVAREARSAHAVAEEGVARLAETVREMERVKATSVENVQETYSLLEQSREIGTVMRLINEVAAKTKLIAFNAAIEASAAGGEAGRRFAVVAQEVRGLAERVVRSTGDIDAIVRDIQGRVQALILKTEDNYRKIEKGFGSLGNARSAIDRILTGVELTEGAASAIESTVRAQRTASDQVLASLGQIDQTTRAFRANILEMKATADALQELFVGLQGEIGRFRVAPSTRE